MNGDKNNLFRITLFLYVYYIISNLINWIFSRNSIAISISMNDRIIMRVINYILLISLMAYLVLFYNKNRIKNTMKTIDKVFNLKYLFLIIFSVLIIDSGAVAIILMIFEKLGCNYQNKGFVFTNDVTFYMNTFNAIIIAPIIEELSFRYVIFSYFSKKYNRIIAIIITSISFAILHGISFMGSFVFSLFSTLLYLKFSKMRYSIMLHILYNTIVILLVTMIKTDNNSNAIGIGNIIVFIVVLIYTFRYFKKNISYFCE